MRMKMDDCAICLHIHNFSIVRHRHTYACMHTNTNTLAPILQIHFDPCHSKKLSDERRSSLKCVRTLRLYHIRQVVIYIFYFQN